MRKRNNPRKHLRVLAAKLRTPTWGNGDGVHLVMVR